MVFSFLTMTEVALAGLLGLNLIQSAVAIQYPRSPLPPLPSSPTKGPLTPQGQKKRRTILSPGVSSPWLSEVHVDTDTYVSCSCHRIDRRVHERNVRSRRRTQSRLCQRPLGRCTIRCRTRHPLSVHRLARRRVRRQQRRHLRLLHTTENTPPHLDVRVYFVSVCHGC